MRLLLVASVLFVAGSAGAESPAVGSLAPAFTLPGSDDRTHTLAEHRGQRPVVLAWFPAAFTPG